MKFIKYPSLTNKEAIGDYRTIRELVKSTDLWYSSEKIHGTNSSIIIDSKGNYAFAMRKDIISENGELKLKTGRINHGVLMEFFAEHDLFNKVKHLFSDTTTQVTIFGEIYGHNFFQMNYKTHDNKLNSFRVFNIFLTNEFSEEINSLGYENMYELFPNDCVPIIATGTFSELVSPDVSEKSDLGAKVSEGIVVQPYHGQIHIPGRGRYHAVKCKTTPFIESHWSFIRGERKPVNEHPLQSLINSMVNEARFESLISKGYEVDITNPGQVIKAFREDITDEILSLDDIEYTYDEIYELTKKCSSGVFQIMKENKNV